jgi:CubicO group peptidase (beta-lactamase class C family)
LDRVEPPANSLEGRLDQWVRFLDQQDRPGGAIALIRSGKVTYAGAFGLADLTHRIPFTTNTPSNIGSVSKPLTAFAIQLLEKEGKLTLTDDVRRYLPDLPDFGQPVTLLHLLTHTAGLRELYALLSMQGRIPGRWTREDLIQLVQRQQRPLNPPGQTMMYTNTHYILLAEVVEQVTGVPFAEWMEENVFGPLGMEHTTVKTHGGQIIPNVAEGYVGIRGEQFAWKEEDELDAFFGATGVYSTVEDLARWVENLHEPRVGGAELVARMTERGVLSTGDTLDYGLGLFVDTHRGLRRYYHIGEDGGHFAAFCYYPEIDAGVAYISNNGRSFSTLRGVTEDLFGEEMAVEGVSEPPPPHIQERAPVEVKTALMDAYTGEYGDHDSGLKYVFSREGDHLSMLVSPWWSEPYRITFRPVSDSSFVAEPQGVLITFRRDSAGTVDRLTGLGSVYRRLTPYQPSADDLTAFAGSYHSEELEVIYRLRVEGGDLRLTNPRSQDSEVRPWEPDVLRTTFPLTELRFRRGDDGDGEVSGFVAANGVVFRKVR